MEVCLLWQDVSDVVYCASLQGFLCNSAAAVMVGVIAVALLSAQFVYLILD